MDGNGSSDGSSLCSPRSLRLPQTSLLDHNMLNLSPHVRRTIFALTSLTLGAGASCSSEDLSQQSTPNTSTASATSTDTAEAENTATATPPLNGPGPESSATESVAIPGTDPLTSDSPEPEAPTPNETPIDVPAGTETESAATASEGAGETDPDEGAGGLAGSSDSDSDEESMGGSAASGGVPGVGASGGFGGDSEEAGSGGTASASGGDTGSAGSGEIGIPGDKTLRVFYVRPTDVPFDQSYPDGIAEVILEAQQYYQQELGVTFTLNNPIVEVVEGEHDASWYTNTPIGGDSYWYTAENLQAELVQRFDLGEPDNRWKIVAIVSAEGNGGGGNGWVTLTKHDADGAAGLRNEPMSRWYGGMIHEMGHMFTLPDSSSTDGTPMSGSFYDYPDCHFSEAQKNSILSSSQNSGFLN